MSPEEPFKCAGAGCGMAFNDFNHIPDDSCFRETIAALRDGLHSREAQIEKKDAALESGLDLIRELGRRIVAADRGDEPTVMMVEASDLANCILQSEKMMSDALTPPQETI